MPMSWYLEDGYRGRGAKIFLWKKAVTVAPQVWVDGKTAGSPPAQKTAYPTLAEAAAAYAARCAEVEALGWARRLREPADAATKRATPAATEAALEALSVELATALRAAGADAARARAALQRVGASAEQQAQWAAVLEALAAAATPKPAAKKAAAATKPVAAKKPAAKKKPATAKQRR